MNVETIREIGTRIKVIVCDLDQTLLNSQKKISRANSIAIRSAQNKGIFVTISSGRVFTMLKTYEKELAINGPLITTNGAVIIDSRDDKIAWSKSIDRQITLDILHFASINSYDYAVLTGDTCYFSPKSILIQRFQLYNTLALSKNLPTIPLVYLNGSNSIIENQVYKILLKEKPHRQNKEIYQYLKQIETVNFTHSGEGLLDIMPAGVDKGLGVRELRRLLGAEKEEVCVFGDYLNDLPMFGEAGMAIAMDNAHDILKRNAMVITDHHDSDGVAKAIHKYIL